LIKYKFTKPIYQIFLDFFSKIAAPYFKRDWPASIHYYVFKEISG